MHIELNRINAPFHFEAFGPSQLAVDIDAAINIGGNEQGLRPMELIAMGLGGCAAIDFVYILKKQRQDLQNISVSINAKRIKNKSPSPFESIDLHFTLEGELDENKVERALALSIEKYCSAAEMVKSTAHITYSFTIK